MATYSYNLDNTIDSIEYGTGIKIDYQYTKDKDIKAITIAMGKSSLAAIANVS